MKARHILYGIGVVLGGLLTVSGAGALSAQEDVDIYFSFNPTIGLTLSGPKITIDNLTPGTAVKSSNLTITINSNNAYGYKLLATAGDGADYTNNNLVNGEATFASVAVNAGTALASLSDNTWGWAKNNVDAFYGLPYVTSSSPAVVTSTSDASAGTEVVNFAIGAKAAATQISGEYTNVINFALVGNVVADSIEEVMTMQEFAMMTTAQKTSVVASMGTGGVYTLTDDRDGTEYKVAKLKDGKVWMLDNLALDLTDDSILAGLNAYNTDASALSLSYLKGDKVRDPSTDASGNYATAKVADWTSSASYSAPLVNMDSASVVPQGSDPMASTVSAGGWKVGGYYNYCAATAGSYCYGNGTSAGTSSGNATESICPKGWRLPTGNTSGEYASLYGQYNNYTTFRTAFKLPLSGYFDDGAADYQGSDGIFWSSTYYGSDSMYLLYADTSAIYLSNSNDRDGGLAVRCVLDF